MYKICKNLLSVRTLDKLSNKFNKNKNKDFRILITMKLMNRLNFGKACI